mmetsp:Transcript_51233/g.130155  ORF Transcript_51233/g.130155 Transcript_51233/m.130155 type:complete len:219 (+) Transcript_51233:37-693(+)
MRRRCPLRSLAQQRLHSRQQHQALEGLHHEGAGDIARHALLRGLRVADRGGDPAAAEQERHDEGGEREDVACGEEKRQKSRELLQVVLQRTLRSVKAPQGALLLHEHVSCGTVGLVHLLIWHIDLGLLPIHAKVDVDEELCLLEGGQSQVDPAKVILSQGVNLSVELARRPELVDCKTDTHSHAPEHGGEHGIHRWHWHRRVVRLHWEASRIQLLRHG